MCQQLSRITEDRITMPPLDHYTVRELYGMLQHMIMTGRGGYRIKTRGKNHILVYLKHDEDSVSYVDLESETEDKRDGYLILQA